MRDIGREGWGCRWSPYHSRKLLTFYLCSLFFFRTPPLQVTKGNLTLNFSTYSEVGQI